MSRVEFTVGSPEPAGQSADKLFKAAFADVTFPAQVTFSNLLSVPLVLAEVPLSLKASGKDGSEKTATVNSAALMVRVCSSIEQIASLRHAEKAVTVSAEAA